MIHPSVISSRILQEASQFIPHWLLLLSTALCAAPPSHQRRVSVTKPSAVTVKTTLIAKMVNSHSSTHPFVPPTYRVSTCRGPWITWRGCILFVIVVVTYYRNPLRRTTEDCVIYRTCGPVRGVEPNRCSQRGSADATTELQFQANVLSLLCCSLEYTIFGQKNSVMGKSQLRFGFKSRFGPFWRFDLRCKDSIWNAVVRFVIWFENDFPITEKNN